MFSPGQALLSIGGKIIGDKINRDKIICGSKNLGQHNFQRAARYCHSGHGLPNPGPVGLWTVLVNLRNPTNQRSCLNISTRWIFAICSCFPAIVELIIMVGVLGLKKPV